MNVSWVDVPVEVRSAMEPHIEAWRPFAPLWLDHLAVCVADDDPGEETPLSITAKVEYRMADLFVHPWFLRLKESSRRAAVIHELGHVVMDPAEKVFLALLKATVEPDSELWIWATEQHRLAIEACVTDLELGVGRLMNARGAA